MVIIDINNLTVSFGERDLFSGVNLVLQQGQCMGLIGVNGAGKTTLMKVLVGKQEYSSGRVSIAKGSRIGYLAQQHEDIGNGTVWEQAQSALEPLFAAERKMHEIEAQMAADGADLDILGERYHSASEEFEARGGYGWQSKLRGVLMGLGLREDIWQTDVSKLSGGEKTRLALAKLLLEDNDILLLDEPTNHLDIEAAQWLTDFLSRFRGTVMLVSHDRYMLDKLCTSVAQFEGGKLSFYTGNYTQYCQKRDEQKRLQRKLHDEQQSEIKRQREIIERYRSFNREKSIKAAESREKAIDRMEIIDAPDEDNADMRLRFEVNRSSGGDVLTVDSLKKAFGNKILFDNFNARVFKGQKIVIIGANGAGKTTLLEILLGKQFSNSGRLLWGVNVDKGYYQQNHADFMKDESIIDMVWRGNRKLNQTQIRSCLAAMLFRGEDVFKSGTILSGGERARCALCKLAVSGCNTLILDEPTNHLDMNSREILEDALVNFDGTVLAVSHDRYFINKIADTLWIIENGGITVFEGGYDDYLLTLSKQAQNGSQQAVNKTKEAKNREQERLAREEKKKLNQAVKNAEETVNTLEKAKEELENAFGGTEIYIDNVLLLEKQKEYKSVCARLDVAMEEWMELSTKADKT